MANECALTTYDNPFDPFTQFDSWFAFDTEKGYYTCSRIARLTNLTDVIFIKVIEYINKFFYT